MVVLKRNDLGGATHTDPNENKSLYFRVFGEWWNLFTGGKWQQFCQVGSPRAAKLKPIEKNMKEYLDKDYVLRQVKQTGGDNRVPDGWIEIPEGADFVTKHKTGTIHFWRKGSYKTNGNNHDWIDMTQHNEKYDAVYWCENSPSNIIWQRHSHPEELPFIDGEPLQSLNDQYAEIETVRQSAWKKQEGGSHYKNLKIQPMQYALENKLDYAQANVVKYVTRHKEKNGKEDLLKAIHNLELMIEFYYGDEK